MKFTPPGTPAPIRKKHRPSSRKNLSVSFFIRQSMGPIWPKCPMMRPAISVPPEAPSEKLTPGILMHPMMLPKTMASTKGKKP